MDNNNKTENKEVDINSLSTNHQSAVKQYAALLKSFQRWVLVMLYPSLLSAVAACFSMKTSKLSPIILTAHEVILNDYFTLHPLGASGQGNENIYGYLILICVGIIYCAISYYLISQANKNKKYPLIVLTVLYGIDFIISCLLVVIEPKSLFNVGNYIGNMVVHVIFLSLFIVAYIKYGKLNSFIKKYKGE